MRTKTIAASMAAASLLLLAACGGGGGEGGGGARSMIDRVQTADPAETHAAADRFADNLPAFGSVTQSSNGGSTPNVTGDAASTSFDGSDLELTVVREDGTSIELNTADHSEETITVDTAIPGHDRARGHALLSESDDSASIAAAYVSWDNSDPTDYLAGGYWLHVVGDLDAGMVTGAEIGAFVDGPELDGSVSVTSLTGTATYEGETEGLFVQRWGTDDPGIAEDSTMIGAYQAMIELTADFDTDMISGCVGCTGDIEIAGLFEDGTTGVVTEREGTSDTEVMLGEAPITADGTFRNNAVMLTDPDFTITDSSGSWGGRFSNVLDADVPRLVAGTYGGKAATAGGTAITFVGAYFANKQ